MEKGTDNKQNKIYIKDLISDTNAYWNALMKNNKLTHLHRRIWLYLIGKEFRGEELPTKQDTKKYFDYLSPATINRNLEYLLNKGIIRLFDNKLSSAYRSFL